MAQVVCLSFANRFRDFRHIPFIRRVVLSLCGYALQIPPVSHGVHKSFQNSPIQVEMRQKHSKSLYLCRYFTIYLLHNWRAALNLCAALQEKWEVCA